MIKAGVNTTPAFVLTNIWKLCMIVKNWEDDQMLRIFHSMKIMSFSSLVDVYSESLFKTDSSLQRIQTEQDFYSYLKNVFFRDSASFYAVWDVQGQYISALRIEPYRDGVLLEALETAPDARGCGYATKLLAQTICYLSENGIKYVYSHVDKNNIASLRVHEKCGFDVFSSTATFIDRSFSSSSYTLRKAL